MICLSIPRGWYCAQAASKIVNLEDTRVKFKMEPGRNIGKEPDAAAVALDLLLRWADEELAGSIVWEGGVGNEDEKKLVEEMFL